MSPLKLSIWYYVGCRETLSLVLTYDILLRLSEKGFFSIGLLQQKHKKADKQTKHCQLRRSTNQLVSDRKGRRSGIELNGKKY